MDWNNLIFEGDNIFFYIFLLILITLIIMIYYFQDKIPSNYISAKSKIFMSLNFFSIPSAILISNLITGSRLISPAFPLQGYLTIGVGAISIICGIVIIFIYANKHKEKYMIPFYSFYFLIFIILTLLLYSILSYQAKPDYNAPLGDFAYPFKLLMSVIVPFVINYALVGLLALIKLEQNNQ